MDLLEHQGKDLFAAAGLPVPPSACVGSPAEAGSAAARLGCPVVVKAQVGVGGRGKAGGVRICLTPQEAEAAAAAVLGMTVAGHGVSAVLVEKAVESERELYLAISSSRSRRGPVLVFSRAGGVDIEEVAARDPEALVRRPIDPLLGLCDYQVRDVVAAARFGEGTAAPSGRSCDEQLAAIVRALWCLYRERDATLAEVNPLALTRQGELICLDSKVALDDNALFRQPQVEPGVQPDEREARAKAAGLTFVPLHGDIGVIGNGAGLVMSTLDQIAAAGGAAADFCDIGGGARADTVRAALGVVLSSGRVNALLVNVFGGITRCDEVARGMMEAFVRTRVEVPVVVRLEGTAAAEGHRVLAAARIGGLTVVAEAGEAVRAVVAAARERSAAAAATED